MRPTRADLLVPPFRPTRRSHAPDDVRTPAMTGVGARADVGPASWEIPAAAALAWLAAAALLLPAGRGVAAMLAGGGWVWPTDGPALASSVGGLLVGDPDTGLDATRAAALPGTPAVYAVIAVLLVAFLIASGGAVWAGRRVLGTPTGMADRRHVEQVLGRSRLRRAAAVVRPDLRAPAGRAGRAAELHAVGWRLGVSSVPAGGELWVPFDRTTGVYGPQGSG